MKKHHLGDSTVRNLLVPVGEAAQVQVADRTGREPPKLQVCPSGRSRDVHRLIVDVLQTASRHGRTAGQSSRHPNTIPMAKLRQESVCQRADRVPGAGVFHGRPHVEDQHRPGGHPSLQLVSADRFQAVSVGVVLPHQGADRGQIAFGHSAHRAHYVPHLRIRQCVNHPFAVPAAGQTEDTPAPTGRSSGAGWDLVLFAVVYGGLYFALYALQFFLPQLVASLAHGTATLTAATLAALPYGVAALAMLAWSHRSIDRSGAQAGHITLPTTAAGSAALGAALSPMSPIVTLSWLTIAVAGILAAMPAFWSRCTAALAGPRVAVAIATVNAVASLASFAGPYATGHLKDATGTYHLALLTVAAVLAAAAACSLLLRHAGRTVCANDSEIMLHPSPATPFV